MKYLLLLLVSINSFAATPGAVPSVTVSASGANTANVSISPAMLSGTGVNGIFSLYAYTASSGAAYFNVLRRNGQAYATGSTTKAYCFDITGGSSADLNKFQLVSSQSAITDNTNTALTNGVFQGGVSGVYPILTGPSVYVPSVIPGTYVFGDGAHVTYAGIQTGDNSAQYFIHMDCYEQ